MNRSKTCDRIDVTLSPNAVLPHFVNKSTSTSRSQLTKFIGQVVEFAKEDANRLSFALKVGLAMLVVSLLVLVHRPFQAFGTNIIYSILTVGIMFEYTVGATLYRGFNRAIGSLLAGIFAVFVIGITLSCGHLAKPYVIGFSIFLVGAATSFIKQWPSLASYEYGFRVTLFTYCLIVISAYRMDNPVKTAVERLYAIAIGAAVAVGINVLVFPAWAGEQLHDELVDGFYSVAESLEDCVKKYLSGDGLIEQTECCKMIDKFDDDPAYRKFRYILNSSARIDTLAISAKWEPPHGRFKHYYHTWSEYVKVGAVLRHCAYEVMALYGCLRSEIQAPHDLRIAFQKDLLEAAIDAAELLRSLASDISNMKQSLQTSHLKRVHLSIDRLQSSIDLHSIYSVCESDVSKKVEKADADAKLQTQYSYHEAMKKQQRRLYSWPSRVVDELGEDGVESGKLIARMRALESTAALSLATFALLLVEFVARLDHLVDAVDELAATAKFKQVS
ncbi:aluminum-activated malate transporter 9-like [Canna indica]|uniref:Aluminum-activated malate transporter 9-like n=1 Tax=Canna indica TaxID=4628 RepID=A0AAQ3JKU9_9LILI|nr:aluminum-activated malate transporter 9-like [Canna indica]